MTLDPPQTLEHEKKHHFFCLSPLWYYLFFVILRMSGLLFLHCDTSGGLVDFARLIYIPRHLSRVRPKSPKWFAAVSVTPDKTVREITAREAESSSRLALTPKRWEGSMDRPDETFLNQRLFWSIRAIWEGGGRKLYFYRNVDGFCLCANKLKILIFLVFYSLPDGCIIVSGVSLGGCNILCNRLLQRTFVFFRFTTTRFCKTSL